MAVTSGLTFGVGHGSFVSAQPAAPASAAPAAAAPTAPAAGTVARPAQTSAAPANMNAARDAGTEPGINVIPVPAKVTRKTGVFVLDAKTRVQAPAAL
ncbi:MAG TPA: hypothetical protein VGG33_00110, partial [Polyangia bacterium]